MLELPFHQYRLRLDSQVLANSRQAIGRLYEGGSTAGNLANRL